MDTLTTQQNTINEAFNNIPPEVEEFMWSDAYTIIVDAIKETLSLTDAQRDMVRQLSYDLLLKLKTVPQITEEFLNAGISQETTAKIIYLIDSEITTRAVNIAEFYAPHEDDIELEEKAVPASPSEKPAPDVFTSLEQRLKNTTVVAPIARATPLTQISVKEVPQTPPRIDPYRELPEK